MSEKRFELDYIQSTWWRITDNITGKVILNKEKEVVELLNTIHEENQELKEEKESWKSIACRDLSKWSIFSREVSILHETRDIDRFLEKYYKYCADMVMNNE